MLLIKIIFNKFFQIRENKRFEFKKIKRDYSLIWSLGVIGEAPPKLVITGQ